MSGKKKESLDDIRVHLQEKNQAYYNLTRISEEAKQAVKEANQDLNKSFKGSKPNGDRSKKG